MSHQFLLSCSNVTRYAMSCIYFPFKKKLKFALIKNLLSSQSIYSNGGSTEQIVAVGRNWISSRILGLSGMRFSSPF